MTTSTLFGQPSSPATLRSDAEQITLGVEFSLSEDAGAAAVWFYSPSGAGALPTSIAIYKVSDTSLIHSETPSWSGVAGSGWIRAGFAYKPALSASTNYKACVFNSDGSSNTYGLTSNYWSTGAGASGVTNGILSAPNASGASPGQCSFNSGSSLAYPGTASGSSGNYWVDIEVVAGEPYVVQSFTLNDGSYSGAFDNPVSEHNTIVMVVTDHSTTPATLGIPVYDGSEVDGATKIVWASEIEPPDDTAYANAVTMIWLLPDVPTSGTTLSIPHGTTSFYTGIFAYEIANLGSSPVVVQFNKAGAGDGVDQGVNATDTSAAAGNIVFASLVQDGTADSYFPPGSPWVSTGPSGDSAYNSVASYQVTTEAGQTLDYTGAGDGGANWSAVIAEIAPGDGSVSASGAIALKKMVLSGASTEKAVVTGAVNLKKMSVAGTGRAGPYSFFGPNGDGNHGSSSSLGLTGGWIAGLLFMVTEDNYELSGYSQWCADSAQAASTIKFALWQATGGSTGTLVASSEATLGTQTPGAWASVSLGTPIALTKNQVYKVVAGTTSNLPWDNGQFSTAGQYVNGSVNGPLTLFSSDSGDGGTNYDTYGDGQASYQWTNPGPTDPASQYPGSLFGASNSWTDVIVQLPVTGNPAITGAITLKKMVLSGSGSASEIVVTFLGNDPGSLDIAPDVGDTVLIFVSMYDVTTGHSSDPTIDGTVVSDAVQVWEVQDSGSSNGMYSSCWMLPNVQSSNTNIAISSSGGSYPSPDGGFAFFGIKGLGSSPILDRVITAHANNGDSDIGPTSAIRHAQEVIVAQSAIYGSYADDGPGSPWTSPVISTGKHGVVSYQTTDTSGGTYSWSEAGNNNAWAGGIATIAVTEDAASVSGALSLKKMVLSASVTDSAGISFDSINYSGAGLGPSCEVTIPDGINDDDLLLLCVNAVTNDSDGDSAVLSISSTGTDWTQPDDSTVISSGTSSGFWAIGGFFYCGAASTSDAGKVVTVSSTVDLYWELTIAVYSRAEVEAFQGAAITGAATVTSPELTSSHDGDWVLYFGGTTDATDHGAYVTYPSGTLRGVQESGEGVAGFLVDSDGSVGNAGTSVGDGAWTDTEGGSVWNTAFTVILNQPSSGVSASGAITLKKMVLSGSHEKAVITGAIKLKKMVVAASGAPSLTVAFQSTSGGVDTYTTVSPINGASATMHMRVLAPVSPNPSYPHAFLWLLPVEGDQGTGYGDSIQTVKDLSANDNYNLTCIQPGFYNSPWYGDNVDDPTLQDETFLMQLVAWADAHLSTTGTEKHYLIGFSKSGFGGQAIFWRHQPKFSAVASWDTACDLQLMTDYGGDPDSSFGEQSQLDLSKLYDPNLTTWKAEGDTGTVNRIYLAAGINLITPTSDYSDRLTADGILHSYTFVEADSHQWAPTPGWVGPALAAIIPPSANTVTVAISLKKMVLSGTSHEKTVISGTIKLKKMVISGASHEKAVITGTITLKKMRVHGEEAKRKASTLFVFWPL